MITLKRWRPRSNPPSVLAGVLALLLLPLLHLTSQDLTDVSLTYLEQARMATAEEATAEARRYLETALALTPELADLRVAMAEHLAATGARGEAIEHLRRALSAGRFVSEAPDRARLLLAELLMTTREYRGALETLSTLSLPSDQGLYLRGEALIALGRRAEAQRVADRGRALYPRDPRFLRLAYAIDPLPPLDLGRWLNENSGSGSAYLELYRTYLFGVRNRRSHRREAQRYLELGGEDPAVVALFAPYLDAPVESFLELNGHLDKYALELAGRELAGELRLDLLERSRERLGELAEAGSVRLDYDPDRDGVSQGSFIWGAGRITGYEVDENQDGVPELTVTFGAEGAPVESSYLDGPLLSYSRYPNLASAEYADGDQVRSLFLRADVLTHYALERRPSLYESRDDLTFRFEPGDAPPDLELLRRYTALEVLEGEGVTYRRILDGVPVIEYRDGRGDGVIEEVRVFEEGRIAHALLDPDGDGAFELYEFFGSDGVQLQGVDRDETGRSEIFAPFITRLNRFDSDEDGLLDYGVITDEIMRFMEIEATMRNNLAFQIEQFGSRTAP